MALCELQIGGSIERFVVPRYLVDFLQRFDGKTLLETVIREQAGTSCMQSPEKLLSLVTEFLVPRGLLISIDTPVPREKIKNDSARYLYIKIGLLPDGIVHPIANKLTWLFNRYCVICALLLIVASQIIFFAAVSTEESFNLNRVSGVGFWWLLAITTLVGLFHEIGHATALRRYGGRNASIGWGVYLVFSVFYTDLSDAWRLRRLQRAVVDLGGVYFHCLSIVVLLTCYLILHQEVLAYCILFLDFQIAGCFNPFLRMDGYWLASDLLGIADLRRQSIDLTAQVVGAFKERRGVRLLREKMRERQTRILTLYVVFSSVFFVYISGIIAYQLFWNVMPQYPNLVRHLFSVMASDGWSSSTLIILSETTWKGVSLLGLSIFLYRSLVTLRRPVYRAIRSLHRRWSQRLSMNAGTEA